jgi:hypothetical protein
MAQSEIVLKTLQKAISMLNSCGTQYKIIDSEGNEYGTLELMQKKKKVPNPNRIYGELRNHYFHHIFKLAKSEIAQIPVGKYNPEDIRSGVCAWATTNWGKGSYTTNVTKDKQFVEVMRF